MMMMTSPFFVSQAQYVPMTEYLALAPAPVPVQYFPPEYIAAIHQQFYQTVPAPAPSSSHHLKLLKLQLSREQMMNNGFPVRIFNDVHVQPNEYQQNRKMFVDREDCNRVCVRCHKKFVVGPNGLQARSPTPVCFNPITGAKETFHVTDQACKDDLTKFESAPKDVYNRGSEMFAIDVEMVFTTKGQEVGRVTVVQESGETVLDLFVRPAAEILDPMTRFSGLVVEDLTRATETIDSARQKLLSLITDQSILVGHGLYGDLKALGIIHNRVIDTSVIFRRQRRRPSLRHLTAEHLGWTIQQETHCSHEDALAALKLVYFAINNPHFLAPEFENALQGL